MSGVGGSSKTLEFILKVKDEASGAFKEYSQEINAAGDSAGKAAVQVDALGAAMDKVDATAAGGAGKGLVAAAAKIQSDTKNAAETVKSIGTSNAAFMKSLSATVNNFGKSQLDRLKDEVEQRGLAAEASSLLSSLEQKMADAEHASSGGHGGNHGAQRETLVLFHELASGRYKNAVSSFSILLGQLGVMQYILTPVGLGFVALTAAVGAFGFAALEGAASADKFNKEMVLTNNYLGITRGEFDQMAEAIGTEIPGGVLKARNAMNTLTDSGKFTSDGIEELTKYIVELSNASGESADKVADGFVKGMDDVSKFAREMQGQYHNLTEADIEYVDQLAKQGRAQDALVYIAEKDGPALQAQLQATTQQLGIVMRTWDALGSAATNAWDAMMNIGRPSTPESQLQSVQDKIKGLQQQLLVQQENASKPPLHPGSDPFAGQGFGYNLAQKPSESIAQQIAALQAQAKALQDAAKVADDAAAAKSKNDQIQLKGTQATDRLKQDPFDKGIGSDTAAAAIAAAIKQHDADIAAALAANPHDEIALAARANEKDYIAKTTKQINDEYNPPALGGGAAAKLDNADTSQTDTISDQIAKTQQQIADMQKYGKVLDDTNVALVQMEISQGKLKGLPKSEIDSMVALASEADSLNDKLKSMQALQEKHDQYQSKISNMQDETQQLQDEYRFRNLSTTEMQRQVDLLQLKRELDAGIVSQAEYQHDAQIINSNYDAKGLMNKDSDSPYQDWVNSTQKDGLNNTTWQKSMTDGLTSADDVLVKMIEGTERFNQGIKDVAKSIETDLLSALTKTLTNNLITGLFGGGDGKNGSTSGSGLIGGLFASGSLLGSIFGNSGGGSGGQPATSAGGGAYVGGNLSGPTAAKPSVFGNPLSAIQGLVSSGSSITSLLGGAFNIGKDVLGMIGFANGGIMTPMGPLPLRKYASGGVASSPQVAMFGEGKKREAYVPLPDGRSIPVSLRGSAGGGGTSVMTNSFVVNLQTGGGGLGSGPGQTNPTDIGNQVAQAMKQQIVQTMIEQSRVGGVSNPALS